MEINVTIQTEITKEEATALVKLLDNVTLTELKECNLNPTQIQLLFDMGGTIKKSLNVK